MKCRWTHCKHGGEVDKDDAVKVGSAYYHKDCYAEKEAIQNIINLYHEKVDPRPIESYLRGTVNSLIYKDKYSAEFLLYAFRYCLNSGWTFNHPAGLRHAVKNVNAKKAWDKEQEKKVQAALKEKQKTVLVNNEFVLDLPTGGSSYVNNSRSKFESVLGG